MGSFYPAGTTSADALQQYARVFDTVEVNATFHAVPKLETVQGWARKAPDGFLFALKTPQTITHEYRLALPESEGLLDVFLERARLLGPHLGPILIQLPPSFDRSPANRVALAAYLDRLPLNEMRIALELRHPAWVDAAVEHALADRNVAWVNADGGRNSQQLMYTANFSYVRWGRSGQEFEDFSEIRLDRSEDMDWWADQLRAVPASVETVFGYMCDEFAGHAPASLNMIKERLGLPVVEPRSTWPQPALW